MKPVSEMTDEEFIEKLIRSRNSTINGFATDTGVKLTHLEVGHAIGEIELEPRHGNPIGSIHGGALFTLLDSIGGAAATSRRRAVTTLSANVNYLTAGRGSKKIIAEATEVKAGKSTCVYRVELRDENGTLLVTSVFTYFYLKGDITLLLD
jgi:acyl-CoA thioesterase